MNLTEENALLRGEYRNLSDERNQLLDALAEIDAICRAATTTPDEQRPIYAIRCALRRARTEMSRPLQRNFDRESEQVAVRLRETRFQTPSGQGEENVL